MNNGKEFELLIEKIYKEFNSGAEVTHNEILQGKEFGPTQIDLTIRYKMLEIDMLIIVQAKDLTRPVSVGIVREFKTVINDVGAQKGILICNAGFTKQAMDSALKNQIEIYSAHQAFHKKWHLELNIPVIKYEDQFEFDFWVTYPAKGGEEITLQENFSYKVGDEILTSPEFGVYAGKLIDFENFDKSGKKREHLLKVDNIQCNVMNGEFRDIIELKYWYRYIGRTITSSTFTPSDYRSLKNFVNGRTIHSYINYDNIFPLIKDKTLWKNIKQSEAVNIKSHHIILTARNIGMLYSFIFNYKEGR